MNGSMQRVKDLDEAKGLRAAELEAKRHRALALLADGQTVSSVARRLHVDLKRVKAWREDVLP